MTQPRYTRHDPGVGELALRPVDPAADVELLHRWLTHPKSSFWLMTDATPAETREKFDWIAGSAVHDAFLGLHEGSPAFLMERYAPEHSELSAAYRVMPGDVGMHFLVAPTDTPVAGFTLAVITTVMDFLFSDPATARVVVEPDVRNTAVHRLNAAVGFRVDATVALDGKDACLSFCTRDDFRRAGPGR